MPDIHLLADLAAEKIRGGYKMPHALNSALKDAGVPESEREKLRHEVAQELNLRSQARRKKNKKKAAEAAQQVREMYREEAIREARHMAFKRRDHLLPDLN